MGASSGTRSSTVDPGRKQLLSQEAQGPMGISSMNRISQGCSRLKSTKSPISSSLNPPMRTVSNFRSRNPAASAASMPSSTSRRVPSRVMAANRSTRSVSRLMFSRSSPASRRGAASFGSRLPLVVRQSSSTPGMARSIRHRSTTPRRTRGSPPVRRIFFTPHATAAPAISASSSRVRMSPWARFSTPVSGIQYWHR